MCCSSLLVTREPAVDVPEVVVKAARLLCATRRAIFGVKEPAKDAHAMEGQFCYLFRSQQSSCACPPPYLQYHALLPLESAQLEVFATLVFSDEVRRHFAHLDHG
jgi:hypothetical protein